MQREKKNIRLPIYSEWHLIRIYNPQYNLLAVIATFHKHKSHVYVCVLFSTSGIIHFLNLKLRKHMGEIRAVSLMCMKKRKKEKKRMKRPMYGNIRPTP